MPPKLSRSAKQALIVSHLRSTRTCHTLKDLEKLLPSVASINGIQVKEYVQELTDDGKISVEKIGSGNWYWCFGGDERKERETQARQLQEEVERGRARCAQTEAELASRRAARAKEYDNGDRKDGDDDSSRAEEIESERKKLMERKRDLERERGRLQREWAAVSSSTTGDDGQGIGIQQMRDESEKYRQQAQISTDNIYILEGYLRKLTADREIIQAVQREIYGDEYVEGEGLRELEWVV